MCSLVLRMDWARASRAGSRPVVPQGQHGPAIVGDASEKYIGHSADTRARAGAAVLGDVGRMADVVRALCGHARGMVHHVGRGGGWPILLGERHDGWRAASIVDADRYGHVCRVWLEGGRRLAMKSRWSRLRMRLSVLSTCWMPRSVVTAVFRPVGNCGRDPGGRGVQPRVGCTRLALSRLNSRPRSVGHRTERPARSRWQYILARRKLRDEGSYFGDALERCGRILVVSHAGQVLISAAASEVVAGRLPNGSVLLDLGDHRLTDLGSREHLWQLSHPDLPERVPSASVAGRLRPQPSVTVHSVGQQET